MSKRRNYIMIFIEKIVVILELKLYVVRIKLEANKLIKFSINAPKIPLESSKPIITYFRILNFVASFSPVRKKTTSTPRKKN